MPWSLESPGHQHTCYCGKKQIYYTWNTNMAADFTKEMRPFKNFRMTRLGRSNLLSFFGINTVIHSLSIDRELKIQITTWPNWAYKQTRLQKIGYKPITLQWRHNGDDSVSNHHPHDCLLNLLFRRRSKLRVTGLCAGNSPGTGECPAQMASNMENVSIWWRHHEVHRQLFHCSEVVFCDTDEILMTSSYGNIFRVTGLLCGEFTGHRRLPLTKASDAEFWCFLWCAPEQSAKQTIETPVIWDTIALIMMSLQWPWVSRQRLWRVSVKEWYKLQLHKLLATGEWVICVFERKLNFFRGWYIQDFLWKSLLLDSRGALSDLTRICGLFITRCGILIKPCIANRSYWQI